MLATFKKALKGQSFLVLDTETTGLDRGEVCQIAIIDNTGEALLNSFVKTFKPIPPDATKIHGITDDMVKDAPTWPTLVPQIIDIVRDRNLVVYNALYDRGIMHQSAERWEIEKTEWKEISNWFCAMEAYAEFYGDFNEYRGNYRWQKLVFAAEHCGILISGAHNAKMDCLMTLGVVRTMLESEDKS